MEESPSGAGSHKRTRPVEAAGAADAQTRPPRLGKHCAFSPSFHRALPHHKHTQRKTRKSTGHWASWSPFSQFRTHMNFRRARKASGREAARRFSWRFEAQLHCQPVVKVRLHSTGTASRLPALLLGHILPVCSLVAPCTGRARHRSRRVSVRRWTFTRDCSPTLVCSGSQIPAGISDRSAAVLRALRLGPIPSLHAVADRSIMGCSAAATDAAAGRGR